MTSLNVILTVAACNFIQFLGTLWIGARVKASIEHEYSKKLEEFKFEFRKREQAARIAEILAIHNNPKQMIDQTRFNQLLWELTLWLPSDIVRLLMNYLMDESGAADPKNILIAIRKQFHGQNDTVTADQIVHVEITDHTMDTTRRPS
jgi:hypothetical protein